MSWVVDSVKLRVFGTSLSIAEFEFKLAGKDTSIKIKGAFGKYENTFEVPTQSISTYSIITTDAWVRTYSQAATASVKVRKMISTGRYQNIATVSATTGISY